MKTNKWITVAGFLFLVSIVQQFVLTSKYAKANLHLHRPTSFWPRSAFNCCKSSRPSVIQLVWFSHTFGTCIPKWVASLYYCFVSFFVLNCWWNTITFDIPTSNINRELPPTWRVNLSWRHLHRLWHGLLFLCYWQQEISKQINNNKQYSNCLRYAHYNTNTRSPATSAIQVRNKYIEK